MGPALARENSTLDSKTFKNEKKYSSNFYWWKKNNSNQISSNIATNVSKEILKQCP